MIKELDQWIMGHEGLRLKPYNDSNGFLSIGWGHNLAANGIPIEIADRMLEIDIATAQKQLLTNFPWLTNIDMARVDALVHLCFWVGIGSFMGFTKMIDAVRVENWPAASNELLNSHLHATMPERCEEIANRLLTGVSP